MRQLLGRLPLVVRATVILTAVLITIINITLLVSSQSHDKISACLQVSLPDQGNNTAREAKALTYMIVDLERQRLIRPLPDNDLHMKTFGEARRIELSPNGKLAAVSGYGGGLDSAIPYFGTLGNGAAQPIIFRKEKDKFFEIEGLEFHWMPDSRTLFGWKFDYRKTDRTEVFTIDQYGNFRSHQLQNYSRFMVEADKGGVIQ